MGSINEKIDYISETKNLIKNSLNDLGAEIDNETTFREYANKIENIYEEWPKVTEENTDIALDNVKKGKMKIELKPSELEQEVIDAEAGTEVEDAIIDVNDVDVNKESYIALKPSELQQKTTTGKNLFNKNDVHYVEHLSFNSNDMAYKNGSATTTASTYYMPCLPNTTYTYSKSLGSFLRVGSSPNVPAHDGTISVMNSSTTGSYATITTGENDNYIAFYPLTYAEISTIGYEAVLGTVQIEEGSTATEYEEYTNGISPNPGYPQNIHIVSGNNEIKIQNKNLFNKTEVNTSYLNSDGTISSTSSSNLWRYTDYIKIKPNTSYTTSGMTSPGSSPSRCYYDKNKNFISGERHFSHNPFISISPNNAYYMIESMNASDLNTVQIEQGSTATEYIEHQEQTCPLSLGDLEYCKIRDYEDMFFKNVVGSEYYDSTLELNKWYLKKNVGKYILDGTENWSGASSYYTTKFVNIIATTSSTIGILGYSNYFKVYTYNNRQDNQLYFHPNGNLQISNLNNQFYATITDWKNLLSELQPTLYIPLATPTNILLSNTLQTQLDNLNQAQLYETTNINSVSNDLSPVINLKYNVVTPAPSPKRSSDIHVVTGDSNIYIQNNNYFDGELELGSFSSSGEKIDSNVHIRSKNFIPVQPNTTYRFSENNTGIPLYIHQYDKEHTFSQRVLRNAQQTFTTREDCYYITFRNYEENPDTSLKIMMSKSSNIQPYVQGKIQSLPLSLGDLEYCKIGNYEDLFFKNVVGSEYYDSTLELDKWYLKKNIDKIVLDGSESYGEFEGGDTSNYYSYYTIINDTVSLTNVSFRTLYSNNYNETSWYDMSTTKRDRPNIALRGSNYHRLYFRTPQSTKGLFQEWLSEHNTIVYYILDATTNILLSDTLQTQLDNIQKAISYQDQTNVSQENDDLPFVIKASALMKENN